MCLCMHVRAFVHISVRVVLFTPDKVAQLHAGMPKTTFTIAAHDIINRNRTASVFMFIFIYDQ